MIGLLTPFRVNNYGTKLQAFAVQESVRALGLETEIVDYLPPQEKTTPKNFIRKCFYRMIRELYSDRRNTEPVPEEIERLQKRRAQAINAFDGQYLQLSASIRTREALQAQRYEAVVAGSDQIFNPVNVSGRLYLLEWVGERTPKIAYSPSFGIDRIPVVLRWKYRKELKRFDALSVREESGLKIVRELGLRTAVQTLDPTLVAEPEIWSRLANDSVQDERAGCVICYFLGGLPLGREVARAAAQKIGRKIVLLPHFKGYVPADEALAAEKLYEVGVPDFLAMIRSAGLVITDSFHATVFAILFHRPFVVVPRHQENGYSTNSRLLSLLSLLGLESRLCRTQEEAMERLAEEIDYEQVDGALDQERKKTRVYLEKSLKGN